jgi:hypothetical protein
LDEGDLDRITAAGEPTIIQVSGVEIESSGEVDFQISYEDVSTDSLVVEGGTDTSPGGQQNLRALILNNIAGENLIANALNIRSQNTTAGGGNQSNQINQSWGSVKVTDVVTVTESISVEGEDADGGDGSADQSPGSRGGICIGLCNVKNSDADGSGGDGSTSPGSTALAAIAYPVWMAADVIIHIEDVSIDNTNSTTPADVDFGVSVVKAATTSLAIGSAAQSDLAALVVNNIAGKNLIANAINIKANGVGLGAGDGTPTLALGGVGTMGPGDQSNTISQFRGTPANAPQPAVVGIATPTGCGISGVGLFSC